jgi:hypothetical protein
MEPHALRDRHFFSARAAVAVTNSMPDSTQI